MKGLLGLAGLVAMALEGCELGHSCNDMGCEEGVTLELASPLDEPGEYQFEAVADGEVVSCTALIPLQRDGSDPVCDQGIAINRVEIATSSRDAVSGRTGDAIVSVWISGQPGEVSLTATRDGVQVLAADVAPRYQGVEINGEGCGECPMATHTIGD